MTGWLRYAGAAWIAVITALLLSRIAIDLVSPWRHPASDSLSTLIYIELAIALVIGCALMRVAGWMDRRKRGRNDK